MHHPHKLSNWERIEISTRQAKWAITPTVFIVVGQDKFVQSWKPARKNLMQDAHTKPNTRKSKKEYIYEKYNTHELE